MLYCGSKLRGFIVCAHMYTHLNTSFDDGTTFKRNRTKMIQKKRESKKAGTGNAFAARTNLFVVQTKKNVSLDFLLLDVRFEFSTRFLSNTLFDNAFRMAAMRCLYIFF